MNPSEETERQMTEVYPDLDRVENPDNTCIGCHFFEAGDRHCVNYRMGPRNQSLYGTNCQNIIYREKPNLEGVK